MNQEQKRRIQLASHNHKTPIIPPTLVRYLNRQTQIRHGFKEAKETVRIKKREAAKRRTQKKLGRILALRRKGMSLRKIGERLHLTHTRIRQLSQNIPDFPRVTVNRKAKTRRSRLNVV